MVIEKVLKVNSSDPKVEELRKRLQAMQQAQQQKPAAPVTPVAGQPPPAGASPTAQAAPAKSQDEIAKLAQLSFEEQKRLLERQNPEIRLKEERTINLVMGQIRELINLSTEANKRIKELELKEADLQKQLEGFKDKNEETLQKMNSIDSRLEKFMGLYELITNQYNPFTENVKLPQLSQLTPTPAPLPAIPAAKPLPPPLTPAKPVTPQAGTFAVQDSISQAKAQVEIKKEDAEAAAHNFQQVEQLLAELHKQAQASPPPSPPLQPPAQLHADMHTLLYGFEERLKKQFDVSLQQQLHTRFAELENHLEEELRDALRRELEQLQQDDAAVQQTIAELQSLVQAKENTNREYVEDEFSELTQQVTRVRDEVKAIPPSMYFRLADGNILRDIHELGTAVQFMRPDVFSAHVTATKNDFAQWVEHALHLPDHAAAIRQATSLDQLKAMFAAARA